MRSQPPVDTAVALLDEAPCGYITTLLDGTICESNRTFETITGRARGAIIDRLRLQDILSVADRIYYETHYLPLLLASGTAREIAINVVRDDGSKLPVLLNSVLVRDDAGEPQAVRTVVFPAVQRRLYEQELLRAQRRDQGIAVQLQRSLLAGTLSQPEGLDLAVRYQSGVSSLEAGGDWYDAYWIEPGARIALVVGDVVGRGLSAAIEMGQLRSATRAFSLTGLDPAGVLEALDGYSTTHHVGDMTTLVYAELVLSTRTFSYASAGHPPPLMAAPGHDPVYLVEARSMGLGPWEDNVRTTARLTLEPGSSVLLYTDGLVETRTRSLDDGLGGLREIVAQRAGDTPEGLCDAIFDGLRSPDYHDDISLVVAQLPSG